MDAKSLIKKGIVVCTRYAPSPTGKLHIGGARTALFNYLLAKKYSGKFILRIEDTDESRNIENGHILIEQDLKFLNIFPDESFSLPGTKGPYLQSQKLPRYEELCEKLLKEGKAYKCFCSEEELESARRMSLKNNSAPIYSKKCRLLKKSEIERLEKKNADYTVRLKIDGTEKYEWNDLIRGNISIMSNTMSDPIIIRSNKKPTYNFAVVVDDYDMGINYVFRGEEHIANTAVQMAIYKSLNWEKNIPSYGHLSIIVDKDGKKMSKRSEIETQFISGLREKGYPPEAIVNYLVLLGWSHGEEEIFSLEELIKTFNIEAISKAPACFDTGKLNWISRKYFHEMSSQYFLNFIKPFFAVDLKISGDKMAAFALANKNNINYAGELNQIAIEFFKKKKLTETMKVILKNSKPLLNMAKEYFPGIGENWDRITIRNYLKQLSEISGLKGVGFFKPLRVCFSLEETGMDLASVMECLGREVVSENLNKSIEYISTNE